MRPLACLLLVGLLAAETYHADPAIGQAGNDGSAAAPWPGLEAAIAAGLTAKLAAGDTLLLRSGDHGDVVLRGDNAERITIAAEPGAEPRLVRLRVDGRKWLIRGLSISVAFAKTPYTGFMASLGERAESSDLVIEDCFVFGATDHAGWSAKEWLTPRNGIELGRHGSHLIARNNYVLNVRFGINLCAPDSLAEGNVISDFSADAMRLTRDNDVARRNVIKNCYLGPADGDDNHDDAIQCFLFGKGTGTMRGIRIVDNLVVDREDPAQAFPHANQGVDGFDGPLVGFTVTGNVIRSATWHGVSFYDAQGCELSGNACFSDGAGGPHPWVMFGTKQHKVGDGNVAKDNLACAFNFKDSPTATLSNNVRATAATFQERFDHLRAAIDAEFGRYHPVAGFARLGTEKGRNPIAPAH